MGERKEIEVVLVKRFADYWLHSAKAITENMRADARDFEYLYVGQPILCGSGLQEEFYISWRNKKIFINITNQPKRGYIRASISPFMDYVTLDEDDKSIMLMAGANYIVSLLADGDSNFWFRIQTEGK